MYKYEIYDEKFLIHSKSDWFSPQDVDSFYEKEAVSPEVTESENRYISIITEIMAELSVESFCVCECEIYREYYGINVLKEKFPDMYGDGISELYETIKDNDILSGTDIQNVIKLILRGHIWCVLKHKNLEIRPEIPGSFTILCADIPSKAIENAKKLEIIIKLFQ